MSIQAVGTLCICGRCKKEMLVEQFLIGVSHTAKIAVTCWSCLTPEEQEKARAMYCIGSAPRVTETVIVDHPRNLPEARPVTTPLPKPRCKMSAEHAGGGVEVWEHGLLL